jgi:hypothetical protein
MYSKLWSSLLTVYPICTLTPEADCYLSTCMYIYACSSFLIARRVFCNNCYSGKSISIAYCGCVFVALGIQHRKGVRSIMLLSVACLAVLYFSAVSHKDHNFQQKSLNIKYVFWFCLQLLSATFLILRKIQRYIIIYVHRSSRNVPVILVRF